MEVLEGLLVMVVVGELGRVPPCGVGDLGLGMEIGGSCGRHCWWYWRADRLSVERESRERERKRMKVC